MTNRAIALRALEAWYAAHCILASLEEPAMSATSIKSLSGQIARVKMSVHERVRQVSKALATAEQDFHKGADGAEAFVGQVAAYTAELQGMTAEMTNGGPPLDDEATFPAAPAAAEPPAVGREAVIATMKTLGRDHTP